MRRIATLSVLPMLLVAACDESRHLWPLDLADTALRTASFAIVNARANAAPIEEQSAPVVYEPEQREEPRPAREETEEALPRSDDEIVSEATQPEEEEEPPLEEVEEQTAEAIPDDAERLRAMEQELAAIEEQLRQQELTNEAIAAVLIVHMQRITLTQLTLAAALGGATKR